MMLDAVQDNLTYITGALFGLTLLLFFISFRLFRLSRTSVYWRKRRDAGRRGWRLFVVAAVLMVISVFSCVLMAVTLNRDGDDKEQPLLTSAAGQPSPTAHSNPANDSSLTLPATGENSLTATLPPAGFSTPAETATPLIVVITATPIFTPTETPFPTFTPYVTPPSMNITPLPEAQLTITALDDQISETFAPVNPRTIFRAGLERIYLFVEFSGMSQGVAWTRQLYHNGDLIDSGEYLWGSETEGKAYFFFGSDTGFEPGNYEIRLFIGDSGSPSSVMAFLIQPAP
ncbi:MAG: hypothetical protein HY866_06255 [Chloroflexi bacterium]|nr:hypothetical protein [Chloroflexota bacterium]